MAEPVRPAHDHGRWRTATQEDRDAGSRAADIINAYALGPDWTHGRWVAIRLSDGGGDGVLYDSKEDALAHTFGPWCTYVCIRPGGITAEDALALLAYYRQLQATGRYEPRASWGGGRQIIPNLWRRGEPIP